MRTLLLLTSFLLTLHSFSQGNQIVLDGHYQDKNLYIQNPFSGNGFCVTKVMVNNHEFAFKNESSFEIDLKSLKLESGAALKIVIQHKADCKPMVLTDNSHRKSAFEFLSLESYADGTLKWSTKNESKNPYMVEHFRWNKWVLVEEIDAKGISDENSYQTKITLHSGENKIRVRQMDAKGNLQYSNNIFMLSDGPKPKLKELSKTDKRILFSDPTLYELYNSKGDRVLSGYGDNADCNKLPPGKYFLNYDNRSAEIRFIK